MTYLAIYANNLIPQSILSLNDYIILLLKFHDDVFIAAILLKMPWDIVSSDFGGEETVNFGPREESGSALYQIDTLATISSQDKVDKELFVSSSSVKGFTPLTE